MTPPRGEGTGEGEHDEEAARSKKETLGEEEKRDRDLATTGRGQDAPAGEGNADGGKSGRKKESRILWEHRRERLLSRLVYKLRSRIMRALSEHQGKQAFFELKDDATGTKEKRAPL